MRKYDSIKERCRLIGEYLVEKSSTVRETAKQFGISKSTVHKDIREKLIKVDKNLYDEAVKILSKNKEERHIRGGIATKNKFLLLKHSDNNTGVVKR
ncbi:MAG: sporulation transcriptional regulator SpoIIID [Clostridia bacterium]|nr:sporulation transcriptional regulator SpoIIID [Clostridia bacterium]